MYSVPALTHREAQQRSLLQQVYAWMAGGLTITGIIAMWAASSGFIERLLLRNSGFFIGLIVLELVLVIALGWAIGKMSATMASAMFVLYSALNGLTLSVVFLVYTDASIASTFLVTAGTFAGMSLYGYTTKRDLTSIGNLLIMALFGFLIGTVVNFFLKSEGLYWMLTYLGIIVFVGLIAYDTQKIKRLGTVMDGQGDRATFQRMVILGALMLYLDFINLFLLLLRILGRRR